MFIFPLMGQAKMFDVYASDFLRLSQLINRPAGQLSNHGGFICFIEQVVFLFYQGS